MRRSYLLVSAHVETVLAFALLAWQVSIPWLVPRFVTQDGPSHLYSASVMRELFFHHAHSIYSPWYTIQRTPLPNWTASIALASIEALVGPDRAERLFVSFAIAAGFLAIGYSLRALAPDANPWTPLSNFLLHTWFLWLGFYNFYLGMALLPFAIGYYARHAGQLTWRRALALTAILLAVFATHLIAGLLAAMAIAVMALFLASTNRQNGVRRGLIWSVAAIVPVVVLAALYALQPHDPAKWESKAVWAWHEFPMHVFATASGDAGSQKPLRDMLLGCMLLSVLLLRKKEWKSPRGALILAAVGAFLLYLIVPDSGVGGSMVKIRFSWAMFLLGGIAALGAQRLQWARGPLALCAALLLSFNFVAATRTLRGMSDLAADYLPVAEQIPHDALFVRLHYAVPGAADRFGYAHSGRDPLAHLDASAAVKVRALDLSDYEALSRNFPLIYKPFMDAGWQSGLYGFEGPDNGALRVLKWLDGQLPKPIEYVLIVGDEASPEAQRLGMPDVQNYLTAHGSLVASSATGWVRLYRNLDSTSRP